MTDPAWVLSLMIAVQPHAPWRATYERTAEAIARVAERRTLFSGEDGARRTAALIVSVAWFEGAFDPKAKGDGECLERELRPTMFGLGALLSTRPARCLRRGPPRSFCTMQVHESNYAELGVTRERVLGDVETCIDAGARMMQASFRSCASGPLEARLDQYAVGGPGCTHPTHDEGGHRVRKGLWLFANVPPR